MRELKVKLTELRDEVSSKSALGKDAADVADALVEIRTYFMPKRAKLQIPRQSAP